MTFASASDLTRLEHAIERAVARADDSDLQVVGYGEVSIALKLSTAQGSFVAKRLVPFSSQELAEHTTRLIHTYIDRLRSCGLDVVETETPVLQSAEGYVVYCVQPLLAQGSLGPDFLGSISPETAVPHVRRIFELINRATKPTLAPDGQLSNWALDGERLLYLDVGTPFMRDDQGNEQFDFGQQTRALPWPIRVIVDRFLIKGILDNYYTIRGQALDFLGNLVKEGLPQHITPLVPVANEIFELDPPITEKEIHAHYRNDARTYALIQAARRMDRWFHRKLLRKTYPYLLPPRIERFGT